MASTVVAQRAAEHRRQATSDPTIIFKRLTVEKPQDDRVVNSPQDTLVLTPTFKASTPETGPRGRASVRRRVPRLPPGSVRRGQGAHAREHRQRDPAVELAARRRRTRSSPPRRRTRRGDQRPQPGRAAPPRGSSTPKRRGRRSTAVDTSAGEVIKPARLPTGGTGVSQRARRHRDDGARARSSASSSRSSASARIRTCGARQDFIEVFDRPPLAEIRIGARARRRAGAVAARARRQRVPASPGAALADADRRSSRRSSLTDVENVGDDRAARRRRRDVARGRALGGCS